MQQTQNNFFVEGHSWNADAVLSYKTEADFTKWAMATPEVYHSHKEERKKAIIGEVWATAQRKTTKAPEATKK